MESICCLVDSIPDHELIGLTCGSELLMKRALRSVHLPKAIFTCFQNTFIKPLISSFLFRKRIIAKGGDALFRKQQPDSTVISEPSVKHRCDASSILSHSSLFPTASKKPLHPQRSSVISLDYDSDHSDSLIDPEPFHTTTRTGKQHLENNIQSPSDHVSATPSFNFSKETSKPVNSSALFYSPKRDSNSPTTTAVLQEPEPGLDDFDFDDFDIDDFNDSDIPGYFDEAPPSSSASARNSISVSSARKDGGPSKSAWENKPTTPVSAPKPQLSSPGKSTIVY